MKFVLILTTSVLLLCCNASAVTRRNVATQHITFIAPASFDKLWTESHVVALARVVGARPELRGSGSRRDVRRVVTVARVKMLEVYKSESTPCTDLPAQAATCSPLAGSEMVILQHAGEVETVDEVIRVAGEPPLIAGREYVVFLVWNSTLRAFVPTYGPYGTFEMRAGAVHRTSKGEFAKEHEGKPTSQFLNDLRQMGRTR